jgi:geranylgeranyl pyrophosphate synthase
VAVELGAGDALARVRAACLALGEAAWPELANLLDEALPEPLDPEALLPVATGLACGGSLADLEPVAAAVVLGGASLRILDDCADQDDAGGVAARIGIGRAANAAAGLSLAALRALSTRGAALADAYTVAYLRVCQGQERDQCAPVATLEEYESVVRLKTVAAYRFAAEAGALAAGAGPGEVDRAGRCGSDLGWCQQILDDLEAWWFPGAAGERDAGRLTYPALYGSTIEHPRVGEARRLLADGPGVERERWRELLDAMGTRPRLMALALDHRDAALDILNPPMRPEGRRLLELLTDWLFRDAERLLVAPERTASPPAGGDSPSSQPPRSART